MVGELGIGGVGVVNKGLVVAGVGIVGCARVCFLDGLVVRGGLVVGWLGFEGLGLLLLAWCEILVMVGMENFLAWCEKMVVWEYFLAWCEKMVVLEMMLVRGLMLEGLKSIGRACD